MDAAMDMEVETSTTSSSLKRFGLKNSIQTNFGEDYVFQIVSNQESSTLAVSLSTNAIKFYSPVTGQYIGQCKDAHAAPINHISFSSAASPFVLHSCSSDGTVKTWDTRTFNQVSLFNAGSMQEVFSFSFGGASDNLLAAGCKTEVACLEESHVDDVTQVQFCPDHRNKLFSASVDGLICTFDTEGNINDDDHLESVMNVGTSIGRIGFCGEMSNKLWCLTHIESLSIWDWKDGRNQADFQDARTLASDSWTLDHVDYFVDCHYSGADGRLWVIGGTNAGNLGYFPVDYRGTGAIGSPEAILEGGHLGVVRSVLPMSCLNGGHAPNQGIFGWTGGEDGRLCCWLSDETSEVNQSWISNALVMKSQKTLKKNRHHPY
ncbi:hypothetical protein IFM89_011296 [Coptis chinensis]|uniref:WD repeat-containing protein 89 homolog n=1 Tax=Coptis chinensis TaxID=261450 RepID=A0A835LVM2_9MAGN|nr:hypothetical protein IFM89_011296 [Coptis chinensis]